MRTVMRDPRAEDIRVKLTFLTIPERRYEQAAVELRQLHRGAG
jgi:hypothetical protein